MIGGAALGTFGCAVWLPLPALGVGGVTPASQRAVVIVTAPPDMDNAGTEVFMVEPQLEVLS